MRIKQLIFTFCLMLGLNAYGQSQLAEINFQKTLESVYQILPNEISQYKIKFRFKMITLTIQKTFVIKQTKKYMQ